MLTVVFEWNYNYQTRVFSRRRESRQEESNNLPFTWQLVWQEYIHLVFLQTIKKLNEKKLHLGSDMLILDCYIIQDNL